MKYSVSLVLIVLIRIVTRGFNTTQSRDQSNQGVNITIRCAQHGAVMELGTAMTDNCVHDKQQGITTLRSRDKEIHQTK